MRNIRIQNTLNLGKFFQLKNADKKVQENLNESYIKSYFFSGYEVTITEFNKKLDEKYQFKGLEKARKDFDEFWKANSFMFTLDEAYRLVNNFIRLLVIENCKEEEITLFINNHLTPYDDFNRIGFCIKRALIYEKYSPLVAMKFLEEMNLRESRKKSNPLEYVRATCHHSSLLIKQKKFDEAFNNLLVVSEILPKLKPIDYLNFSVCISELNAKISFNTDIPNYRDYLFYESKRTLLWLLSDIAMFPVNICFHKMKKEYEIKNVLNDDNADFDRALEKLNIFQNKNEILTQIYNFGFYRLPVIYGIPKEYDTIEKISFVFETNINDYKNYSKFLVISKELKNKSIERDMFEIENFVQELMMKWV